MQYRLTNTAIKHAKPQDNGKPKKHTDGGGLYLLVNQSGKYWRYKYRMDAKERTLAIGSYPEITLKEAREKHQEARALLAKDIDPSRHKQLTKEARIASTENSFELVAREWFVKFSSQWSESHAKRIIRRLERDVFPWLGNRPIAELEPPDILKCLRRIESRGVLETAHRAKQNIGQVMRYAVATGRAQRDHTTDLKGALPPPKKKHFAAITDPKEIAILMQAMGEYTGTYETRCALLLSAYFFTRPGELRRMEWKEINFETKQWVVTASKMKAKQTHIVPLATQSLDILEELQPLTGKWRYVFPSMTDKKKAMSNNTVRQALRRLGYDGDTMTAHGFRALASTRLYELGYPADVIEKQLAHAVGNEVRRAYDRSQHIEQRTTMMQDWADYLDALRDGADTTSFNAKQASA